MSARVINVLLFSLILIADQLTKFAAVSNLRLGENIEVIPGLFNLTLVYNRGAAFGVFSTLPEPYRQIVLGGVSIIAFYVIYRLWVHDARDDRISQFALIGILAGAIGNLIDRVRLGAVVDFLDFYLQSYHWPAFNVADSAISVGVCLVILRLLFSPQQAPAEG